jgi:hypothetical protein
MNEGSAMAGRPPRHEKELPPIGRVLRDLRPTRTMAEAGKLVGESDVWWHRRETGKNAVSVDDLQRIAKAFGVAFIIGKGKIVVEAE